MRIILLPITFCLCALSLVAQLPRPCVSGFTPAVTCDAACIFCNFDGYEGTTVGFPAVQVPKFCGTGTIENVQWLGFIAGAGQAVFTIQPTACFNGDGVQVALYERCDDAPIACNMGQARNDLSPISITVSLIPGRTYYLLIDGFAGDQCDFVIDVNPRSAVYEPPLGTAGPISGPASVCPGGSAVFSIAPVSGAGAYIWQGPPGSKIDTVSLPALIEAPVGEQVRITFGDSIGAVCVSAVNACRQNPPCASTLPVRPVAAQYLPQLEGDTIAHLRCDGTPVELTFSVVPPARYAYQWQTDSTGRLLGDTTSLHPLADRAGTYSLQVINLENGCVGKEEVRVLTPDIPTGADVSVKNVRCHAEENGILEIGAMQGGRTPFMFFLNEDPLSEKTRYEDLKAGEYRIGAETADGCVWDTVIQILEPDPLLLQLGPDTSIGLGTFFRLWDSSYISDPGRAFGFNVQPDSLQKYLQNDDFRPLSSFIYSLTVRDSNGCRASDSKTVRVEKYRHLYLPNVFAPETARSGNERLLPASSEEVALIRHFAVYDRWGNLVHEARNKTPLDPTLGWNGTVEGRKMASGIYVCRVEAEFLDGATAVFFGDVLLMR